MRYVPHTDSDREAMLASIGVGSIEELFGDIPAEVRPERIDLPPAMTEPEILGHMRKLAARNRGGDQMPIFTGAGAYDHYVPSVVRDILRRNEFVTAYTPYQPEVSQGVLQSIYEYQTMICELTGMDVSNASMYDGATALAEAALMSGAVTRRGTVLVSRAVNPEYRQVIKTYCWANSLEVVEVDFSLETGRTLWEKAGEALKDAACLVVQHPNFFGHLEEPEKAVEIAHGAGALAVASVDPVSLALLKPPGEYGFDIVTGEGQPLGNPLSYGGPYLGFFAVREKLVRRMPGRMVGRTVDTEGRRGFVLTLQTREQHIRREKATSNICSNQALNALAAAVYLTVVGPAGLGEIASESYRKAHYARERLIEAGAAEVFGSEFFKEFVVRPPVEPAELNRRLLSSGIIGGYDLGRDYSELKGCMSFCVTEKRTKSEIDRLVRVVGGDEE